MAAGDIVIVLDPGDGGLCEEGFDFCRAVVGDAPVAGFAGLDQILHDGGDFFGGRAFVAVV